MSRLDTSSGVIEGTIRVSRSSISLAVGSSAIVSSIVKRSITKRRTEDSRLVKHVGNVLRLIGREGRSGSL